MYAWLWPAWDALARPEARRRHRAFPRHGPRGQSGRGRGRGRAGRWTWPRRARFLPAGRDLRRPGPVLARGRPASGAPLQPRCHLLLLGFPSSSSFSASSVSRGKAAACCSAPHPRLACPRVGATSKLQKMSGILRELLRVSEKAANIARACRQQEALFQLLIEEKKGGEKNKKFAVDFKTLADVLVQEVIKQNMDSKFPGLGKKILGEESNEFTNDLGEKITMELCSTEEATAELLSRVLNGNKSASEALARVVHEDVAFSDPTLEALDVSIPQDILGIWVDPIDSTYQYIKGSADVTPNQGVFPNGLQCVTILIGVYDIETGMPLMGVINQPFVTQDLNTLRWKGRCYWGLSYMGTNIHSLQLDIAGRISPETQTQKASYDAELSPPFSAVISTSEKESVKAALSRVCGGSIFRAAGAGYKSLCVVQGLVDIYIFSEDTTYKWDVCAAHAILRAMGGGVVDMKECLQRSPDAGLALPQLLYHAENQGASGVDRWANQGGLIAYRSARRLEAFLSHLTQNLSSLETQT